MFGTLRIHKYRNQNVNKNVSSILNFIQNGKDKTLRMIAINQGFNKVSDRNYTSTICKYTDNKLQEEGYEGLNKLTMKDLRDNFYSYDHDSIIRVIVDRMLTNHNNLWEDLFGRDIVNTFFASIEYLYIHQ